MTGYWGKDFFGVLKAFGYTLYQFLQGKVSLDTLGGDEIQILVLACIGVSLALVGAFLVFRKMTMLANSVSHTVLIGIVIAFVIIRLFSKGTMDQMLHIDLKHLLLASLVSSLLTMFLTDTAHRYLRVQKDASIGLVFSFLFALGIVLVTIFTKNAHVGVELIMGNVDMLHKDDLISAFFLMLMNIVMISLFYKEYLVTTFDPEFSSIVKISNGFFSYLLLIETSASIIGAFRAVGVVLVLSLLILPVMTARLLSGRLKTILLIAPLLSIVTSVFAVALSRHFLTVYGLALSTGGILIVLQLFFWGLAILFAPKKGVWIRHLFKVEMKRPLRSPSR